MSNSLLHVVYFSVFSLIAFAQLSCSHYWSRTAKTGQQTANSVNLVKI